MIATALNSTRDAKIAAPAHDLRQTITLVRQRADTAWLDKVGPDLTPPQYAVMQFIRAARAKSKHISISQNDLVGSTHIDRSTLADVVRRLTRKGWLSRRRTKHDARTYNVQLTQAGEDRLKRARAGAEAVEKKLLAGLEPTEARTVVSLLSKMVRNHEADLDRA